jgi:hypothetical protein
VYVAVLVENKNGRLVRSKGRTMVYPLFATNHEGGRHNYFTIFCFALVLLELSCKCNCTLYRWRPFNGTSCTLHTVQIEWIKVLFHWHVMQLSVDPAAGSLDLALILLQRNETSSIRMYHFVYRRYVIGWSDLARALRRHMRHNKLPDSDRPQPVLASRPSPPRPLAPDGDEACISFRYRGHNLDLHYRTINWGFEIHTANVESAVVTT